MEHNSYNDLLTLETVPGLHKWCTHFLQTLQQASPSLNPSVPLSQRALQVLVSSPVDCVLVGMRQDLYVQDVLAALSLPRVPKEEVQQLLMALNSAKN